MKTMKRVLKTNVAYEQESPLHALKHELLNPIAHTYLLPDGKSVNNWTAIDDKIVNTGRALGLVLRLRT